MSSATRTNPDVTTFCALDELGLTVTGQHITRQQAVLDCEVVDADAGCQRCGCQGRVRDTVTRNLAHEPLGWRPTLLRVKVRRYQCTGCRHVWRQNTDQAAAPRARLSRGALRWALTGIVCQHLTVARVAEALGVAWGTANTAIIEEGPRMLIDQPDRPDRFDQVTVIGVDEHCWRHTRGSNKYVTVITDPTPVPADTGRARLLDMVPGRSKQVCRQWLADRPAQWRDGVEIVAMDGFTGFKTAAVEELPDAIAVMDSFHVVRLAGEAVDKCRQRVQQHTIGHRGRRGDLLFQARRILLTGADLLTDWQVDRLEQLFTKRAVWRGRSDLGCVPAHGAGVPVQGQAIGQVPDAQVD